MSQCHDLSDFDQEGYPLPVPCPPPVMEEGCHDSYDNFDGDRDDGQDDRRAASTSPAWSGTTRPRRAGRS